jgi:RNA polymerase sigma-70 factor (ECF subfamily)
LPQIESAEPKPVATLDTDEALVARCRAGGAGGNGGDEAAFAELVGRYREPVFRLAVSILGPEFRADAEDVTQEVFLRVHHGLASFRGEAQFSSWIYRIGFNQAVNLKARVRYRAPHLSEDALAQAASPLLDPEGRLAAARRQQALAECMNELPEVYQSSLRLYYWLGESVVEIATLLGVPENTVKSYLHRARRLLHEMLKERGFEDA